MRPVNLLPAGERRGEGTAARTGPLAYVVVGVLALALVAVAGMAYFGKQVSDREAEVTQLEARAAATEARAAGLSSFVTFQQIHDARVETVSQLARSRFDWERVLRELSKVLPEHVWLVNLTGTVSPEVQVGSGGGDDGGLRTSVPGPALVLTGCARGQTDVARLIAAMKDIDGVTRVTVGNSSKADTASGGGESGDSCQTRPSIPQFTLVAAFDEVVVPGAEGTIPAPATPEAAPTSAPSAAATGSTDGAEDGTDDGGVPETEAQNEQSKQDAARADQKSKQATKLVPGG